MSDGLSRFAPFKIRDRQQATFRTNYLKPALAANLIEMTNPDSPNSPAQRYRLTELGKQTATR
ncbi:Fic family protein [Pseudomonas sp. B21-015]|uniref:Fic family protein n=1 Tax=unclassified Pseudomonas TaxID=196821 RepID=UPI0038D445FE